jgi:glutathione peroxidase-family protein
LIVNVASKCGFTPQYKGLQELYSKYKDQGLQIIGFPCNQFMGQEPGTSDDIASFCSLNYGVSFPIMEKIDVNGSKESPVYTFLKDEKKSSGLLSMVMGNKMYNLKSYRLTNLGSKWNFEKFLVNKEGQVVGRFGSTTKPESLNAEIEKYL